MSTFIRILFVFSSLYFIYYPLISQQNGGPSEETFTPGMFKIVGKVINGEDQSPLEYATVILLRASDSSGVSGATTNAKGAFVLDAKAGSFILKVQYLGFQSLFIPDIVLTEKKPYLKLGDISLVSENTSLDEVEITAERSRMEFDLDKRVFNVGRDLSNIGGTASDLLDNIPSITVDVEGNVNLRGSSGVRILINGKPSGFTDFNSAEALQQLSADMIEKVEIVTNPSARYDAEGTAGIINIVLKKDRRKGWNGSFNVSGGYPYRQNTSVNINHRRQKVNLFANAGFRYRDRPRRAAEFRRTIDSTGVVSIVEQEQQQNRVGLSGSFRMGADYQIDDNTTLTGSVLFRMGDDRTEEDIDYFYMNGNRELSRIDRRFNVETEDEYSLDYAINFERKFKQEGRKLTTDFIYTSGGETEASSGRQETFSPDNVRTEAPALLQQVNNSENQRMITFQSDYVHPFTKDRVFEAGYRGTIRDIDTDYMVEQFDNETNRFESIANLTNDFAYDENVLAAYAIYGDKIGDFGYQLGVRAEYTDIKTLLEVTDERNDRSFLNFFPSAFVSYEISTGNSIQASYSRRINRPRFWDLNPFFSFDNPLRFRSGNPNLNPEFTDAFELNYIKYFEKGSLSSSLYYRNTEDVIVRISTIVEDSINRSRPENAATRNDFGAEFSLNLSPVDMLDLTLSANVYRGDIDGQNLGFRQTEFFSFTSRLNSRLSLPNDWDIQIMINYRGAENTPQGRREDLLFTDLGISKDILKGKATVNLRVTDLFNSMYYRYTVEGDDFFIQREGQWRTIRQGQIGFTYRLNQKKRPERGERGGGMGGGNDM